MPTAGLTEPALIRLDVDTKLNEQLRVRRHLLSLGQGGTCGRKW